MVLRSTDIGDVITMPRVNRKPYQTDYKFDNAEKHYSNNSVTCNDRPWEAFDDNLIDEPWTDEDEAALEEWEEQKRIKLAERNEY